MNKVHPISPILLFQVFAFILGAVVGSFLNVVVYRLPLGLSVNNPKRSFCPHCKTQIPWYENLPLFSWLALRGKCSRCGAPIAFRYFAVELLTALLFLSIWILCDHAETWVLALPLWILTGLLIAATFIDFDHLIIPDEITLGGTAAGLILSTAIPSMMGETSHWRALFWSGVGAGAGYLLLWGVVEAGKLAFGKKKHRFDPPAEFRWTRQGEDAEFIVGEEKMLWSDIFSRETDQLLMETESPCLDNQPIEEASGSQPATLRFFFNRLILPGTPAREILLDSVATLSGKVRSLVVPREAMGFGDVKLIACIGAFLGWKAVLFTIAAGSMIGAVVGVVLLLVGRRDASGRIPFGPYLALGALLWIAAGPDLIEWYLGLVAMRP
jgi:leader peptidase (prepilin peptidase)/N-methyltransferase